MPALHALGQHPALQTAHNHLREETLVAFLDDVYAVVHRPDRVGHVHGTLAQSALPRAPQRVEDASMERGGQSAPGSWPARVAGLVLLGWRWSLAGCRARAYCSWGPLWLCCFCPESASCSVCPSLMTCKPLGCCCSFAAPPAATTFADFLGARRIAQLPRR